MVTKVAAALLLVLVWNSSAESACVARIIEHDVRIDQNPAVYFTGVVGEERGHTDIHYTLDVKKSGQPDCPLIDVTPILYIQIKINSSIADSQCDYNLTFEHEQQHVAIAIAHSIRNKYRISQLFKNFNGFQANDWSRWFKELTNGFVVVTNDLLKSSQVEHNAFDQKDYPLARQRAITCLNNLEKSKARYR